MTVNDLRDLVLVTMLEYGDVESDIANMIGCVQKTAHEWLSLPRVSTWPSWAAEYLERRGIRLVVKRCAPLTAARRYRRAGQLRRSPAAIECSVCHRTGLHGGHQIGGAVTCTSQACIRAAFDKPPPIVIP